MALGQGAAVVPVLVGRQSGRLPDDLPDDIRILADCPYCRYDHREAESGLDRLAEAVVATVPGLVDRSRTAAPAPPTAAFSSTGHSGGIWAAGPVVRRGERS